MSIVEKIREGKVYIKYFPKEYYKEQLDVILEEVFGDQWGSIGNQEGWYFTDNSKKSLCGWNFTINPNDVVDKEVMHVSLAYHLLLQHLDEQNNGEELKNMTINGHDTIHALDIDEKIDLVKSKMEEMFPGKGKTVRILLWDDGTDHVECRRGDIDTGLIHRYIFYDDKLSYVEDTLETAPSFDVGI